MHTRRILVASVLAAVVWVGLATRPAAQSAATAFVGVTVIPMDKDTVLADQAVLVRGGTIASIAPAANAKIPAGAARVDGKGKFLMPGLAEMHAHIPGGAAPDSAVERTLFLYTASGITTIRGMLGDPRHLTYRERAAKGVTGRPAHLHIRTPPSTPRARRRLKLRSNRSLRRRRPATTCSRSILACRATSSTRWRPKPTS